MEIPVVAHKEEEKEDRIARDPSSHPDSTPITDLRDSKHTESPSSVPNESSICGMKRNSHPMGIETEEESDSKRQMVDPMFDHSDGKCINDHLYVEDSIDEMLPPSSSLHSLTAPSLGSNFVSNRISFAAIAELREQRQANRRQSIMLSREDPMEEESEKGEIENGVKTVNEEREEEGGGEGDEMLMKTMNGNSPNTVASPTSTSPSPSSVVAVDVAVAVALDVALDVIPTTIPMTESTPAMVVHGSADGAATREVVMVGEKEKGDVNEREDNSPSIPSIPTAIEVKEVKEVKEGKEEEKNEIIVESEERNENDHQHNEYTQENNSSIITDSPSAIPSHPSQPSQPQQRKEDVKHEEEGMEEEQKDESNSPTIPSIPNPPSSSLISSSTSSSSSTTSSSSSSSSSSSTTTTTPSSSSSSSATTTTPSQTLLYNSSIILPSSVVHRLRTSKKIYTEADMVIECRKAALESKLESEQAMAVMEKMVKEMEEKLVGLIEEYLWIGV